jgi:glycosyltransferase involved in cell wall biosynthesis
MRILMVHNRYLQAGGEDVATATDIALLREASHDVTVFTETNERVATLGRLRTASRALWSRESRDRIAALLADDQYDLMHVQNFFPLVSPSVYGAAARRGVAVVQTLHNYRLLCPAATLYRDGAVCELCVGRRFAAPGVRYACYRDSRTATAVVASMSSAHRMLGTFRRRVDLFTAPSDFTRSKYVEAGWPETAIVTRPNAVFPDPGVGPGDGGFALFAGRLADVKGVATLVEAWRRAEVDLELRIAGDGPEAGAIAAAASPDSRIRLLGRTTTAETQRLMGSARFLVVPSVWYEIFGLVVAEAFARGTPVVASRIGGLTELVDDEIDGILFEPGSVDALAAAIERMASGADPTPMRSAARATYERRFAPTPARKRLEEVYALAIDRAQRRRR